jgi:tRNA pseudouridine38-40 synthase
VTIQEKIELAIREMLRHETTITGAGRTDAGVHARGQVANFFTSSPLAPREIRRGVNALLPEDIVILDAAEAEADFHARFSARSRTYSYTISRVPSALLRHFVWETGYRLDPALMNDAAGAVTGTMDFSSFARIETRPDTTHCTVLAADWRESGQILTFNVTANGFLHGMVRALVGTMVDVGRGRLSVADFREILASRDRSSAGMSAPARGLVLERVDY